MSNNLGSMVLELSANYARFTSDMGKMYQSAQETADKVIKTFERVGAAIGVGIGVDAFKDFIGGAIEAQDEALKFAQKVGISTEAVVGLSSAAKKAGVDQQELQQALTKLAVGASEAGNGVKKYADAYAKLGIDIRDGNHEIKSADVLFGELADKFASYKDSTTKTADAVALLGKSGANLIPLLNGGSAAIQRQIELSKELGAAIGTEAAKGAEEFKDKMHDLGLVSQGVGNQIATGLLPALNSLADAALKFFTSSTWKSWLADFNSAAEAVARHLGDIIATIKLLGEIAVDYIGVRLVGSLITATSKLVQMTVATLAANSAAAEMGLSFSVGVASSIKSIGLLNAALGSVFAAVSGWQIGTYLYNQFAVVRQIAQNFIATFDALWTVVIAGAKGAWLGIEKAFYTMLDAVTGALSDSLAKMAGNFAKLPDALGGSKLSAQFIALSAAIAPSGKSVADLDTKIAALQSDTTKNLKIIQTSWDNGAAAGHRMATSFDVVSDSAKKAAPNIAGLGEANDKAAKAAQRLSEMFAKDNEILAELGGKLGPLQKVYGEYAKGILAATAAYQKELVLAAEAGNKDADLAHAKDILVEKTVALLKARQEETAELIKQNDAVQKYLDKTTEETALSGLSDRQREITKAISEQVTWWNNLTEAQRKDFEALGILNPMLKETQDSIAGVTGSLYDAKEVNQIISEFGKNTGPSELITKLQQVQAEMKKMKEAGRDATDPTRWHELQLAAAKLNTTIGTQYIQSVQAGLHSLQSMTKEGSKAYKEIQIAVDALTVAQAILAVVQAAQLPPPAGFVSMAAMAAAVVALGVDIGNFNSGGPPSAQSAEVRQANQGTGTILGDAKAQSDSIAKATAITADATQQLVGLNRGMLVALQALQNALGAAGVQLARGAGNATFPSVAGSTNAFNSFISSADILGGDPITKALGSFLFGGSKKVIDQGIVIFGGALQDMLNNVAVGAYQTIHKSGGLFGSSKTYDQTQSVSDDFSKQFQLVIGSLVDAVKQGATALGISQDQIDAAIAAYHVAEQHISLKGLSAEDQQKALEAVFSSIFDGLAAAVVPFVGQFQKVGEGLGETLVRVATEVQVTQQAMKSLGLAISETDPEKFAQIADALTNAVGGIDAFISGMNSFVDKFASSDQKFALEKDALTSAFDQVGLSIPATREGMYDLMKSLDASTEAGRAQIATLLRLSDVADQYYSALEKAGGSQADLTAKLQSLVQSTQQIAAQLFGTGIDQLQARLQKILDFGKETGFYDLKGILAIKKQIAEEQEQQAAAQKLQQANSLLGNLGSLGVQTGETLQQLADQFNIPLDKLAEIFHTDQAGLEKQFEQAEATAAASMQTAINTAYANELLANILAAQQGLPLPYSQDGLNSTANPVTASQSAGGGKFGGGGFAPPNRASVTFLKPSAFTANASVQAATTQPNADVAKAIDSSSKQSVIALAQFREEVRGIKTELGNLTQRFDRYGAGVGVIGWQAGGNNLRRRPAAL